MILVSGGRCLRTSSGGANAPDTALVGVDAGDYGVPGVGSEYLAAEKGYAGHVSLRFLKMFA